VKASDLRHYGRYIACAPLGQTSRRGDHLDGDAHSTAPRRREQAFVFTATQAVSKRTKHVRTPPSATTQVAALSLRRPYRSGSHLTTMLVMGDAPHNPQKGGSDRGKLIPSVEGRHPPTPARRVGSTPMALNPRSVRFDADTDEWLNKEAEAVETSVSDVVRLAVAWYRSALAVTRDGAPHPEPPSKD
jgi:hypothetical protein